MMANAASQGHWSGSDGSTIDGNCDSSKANPDTRKSAHHATTSDDPFRCAQSRGFSLALQISLMTCAGRTSEINGMK